MTNDIELTADEKRAIRALKRIAKAWPESLWLFSASGKLCVMRKGSDGERVEDAGGCVDPDYCVDTVDIQNDGGDW